MRFGTVAAIVFSLATVVAPGAQTPVLEPRLSFEVASIKVDAPQTRTPMTWQPGGHFVGSVPALSFISIGYQVPVYRIEGMPDWARTTRFLVSAKAQQQPEIEERPRCLAAGGAASMTSGATELAPLVGMLAGALGRPVIDKTGLTGRFDIDFRAAPPGAREGSPGATLPPISTALEDQLGLKLQSGRGPLEVLVIDRLERPSED